LVLLRSYRDKKVVSVFVRFRAASGRLTVEGKIRDTIIFKIN
jgi:hypothetical protein